LHRRGWHLPAIAKSLAASGQRRRGETTSRKRRSCALVEQGIWRVRSGIPTSPDSVLSFASLVDPISVLGMGGTRDQKTKQGAKDRTQDPESSSWSPVTGAGKLVTQGFAESSPESSFQSSLESTVESSLESSLHSFFHRSFQSSLHCFVHRSSQSSAHRFFHRSLQSSVESSRRSSSESSTQSSLQCFFHGFFESSSKG
jgi:hypothetical protein